MSKENFNSDYQTLNNPYGHGTRASSNEELATPYWDVYNNAYSARRGLNKYNPAPVPEEATLAPVEEVVANEALVAEVPSEEYPTTKKGKFKLNKKERNWALYDAGNSAIYMFFILIGVSIGDLAYGTPLAANPTNTMSLFNAITGLIVALLGPIMGAIADNKGRKLPMFKFFVAMGLFGCYGSMFANLSAFWSSNQTAFTIGFFVPFAVFMCLILIGLGGSLLFYDSMLADVTIESRGDQVSSRGYAFGYIYSVIPFLVCLAIYYWFMDPAWAVENIPFIHNINEAYIALRLAITACLVISGTWWLCFTRPLTKTYVQTTGVDPVKHQIRDAFKKLGKTFSELSHYKAPFLFLIAFFCYINGVNTVIALSATYAREIISVMHPEMAGGTVSVFLVAALILTQVIGCVCSILFGSLAKKVGAKKLILISTLGYLVFVLYAVFMGKHGKIDAIVDFFILASGIGIFQGGIQALSRSYYSRLVPQEKQSEFFGLYDIFNKSSNFIGSFVFYGITSGLMKSFDSVMSNRIAVGCMSIFFVAGFIITCCIPKNHADKVKAQ